MEMMSVEVVCGGSECGGCRSVMSGDGEWRWCVAVVNVVVVGV